MDHSVLIKRALVVVGINDHDSKVAIQEAATDGNLDTVHAASEQEIVQSLAGRPDGVEAVVLDLSCGQHAVDLLRTIIQSENAPPVIVLAGQEQLGAVPVARQTGAAACVRKPFTAEMLASVIEEVCKPEHMRLGSTCDLWGHPNHQSMCVIEASSPLCGEQTLGASERESLRTL